MEILILILTFFGTLLVDKKKFFYDLLSNRNEKYKKKLEILGVLFIFIAVFLSVESILQIDVQRTLISRGYDIRGLNSNQIKEREKESDKALRLYNSKLNKFDDESIKNIIEDKIEIRYYYRSNEDTKYIKEKLNELNVKFKFETFELKFSEYNAGDINYIKFGKDVNVELVKMVLYLLLSTGREIKNIHIHENNKGITIASDSKAIKCKTLDVEKIENLVDNIKTQIDNKTIDVSNYHSCENYPAQTE